MKIDWKILLRHQLIPVYVILFFAGLCCLIIIGQKYENRQLIQEATANLFNGELIKAARDTITVTETVYVGDILDIFLGGDYYRKITKKVEIIKLEARCSNGINYHFIVRNKFLLDERKFAKNDYLNINLDEFFCELKEQEGKKIFITLLSPPKQNQTISPGQIFFDRQSIPNLPTVEKSG